jgi:hypothetical protein
MNPLPTPIPFQIVLENYAEALTCFDHPKSEIRKSQVLKMLLARDALQRQMEAEPQIIESDPEVLSKMQALDSCLRQNAYKVAKVIDLVEYRGSIPVPPET